MAFDKVIDSAKLDTGMKATADAIRAKTGATAEIPWEESTGFAEAVEAIQSGGTDPVIKPLEITESGTYEAPDGVDGYSPVTVNVAASGGSDDGSFKAVIERTATNPTLPSDLTKIGEYAFRGCTKLALTELPAGVTSISEYAFYSCTNLALTELPAGVTSIGNSAFRGCTNLALTELPAGVTSISNNAFYGCTNLNEMTFNGKSTNIGSSAFSSCTNLLTINVPWAEGEVASAPWGATNATINYNYTGEG